MSAPASKSSFLEAGRTSLPAGHSLLVQNPQSALEQLRAQPVVKSSLTARLEAFLPAMKAANEELEAAIAVAGGSAEFQVDAVSDEETEHIVMDVGVMEMTPEMEGVFGEEDADASSAADSEALPTRTKPTPSKPFVEEL